MGGWGRLALVTNPRSHRRKVGGGVYLTWLKCDPQSPIRNRETLLDLFRGHTV